MGRFCLGMVVREMDKELRNLLVEKQLKERSDRERSEDEVVRDRVTRESELSGEAYLRHLSKLGRKG